MKIVKLTLYISLAIALTGSAFHFGVHYGQETLEPQVKIITQTRTKINIETKYIERIIDHYVETPVEVEVVREVPQRLIEFSSLEELKEWLERNDVDSRIPSYPGFDCDDYAYQLQKNAAKDGYIISTELIIENGELHMLNSALIGNDIYFIEPQDDEVWFYCSRD